MSKEIVNIKGTKNGLLIHLDGQKGYQEVRNQLEEKIKQSNGFFKGAKFALKFKGDFLGPDLESELAEICSNHGLVYDSSITEIKTTKVSSREATIKPAMKSTRDTEMKKPVNNNNNFPSKGLTDEELAIPGLVIKNTLRSGQTIRYDGNVVIVGDVNPGAEIIAAGSIVVMGTLKGIAHAGATGDETATIMAYGLYPTQLRIAGMIAIPPDDQFDQLAMHPEVARINQSSIEIEKMRIRSYN